MDKGTLSILVAALMVTSGLFGLFLVGDSAGEEAEEIMGMPPEDTTNRIEMPKSTSDHFTRNMGQWDSGLEYIGKADMGYVGFTRDGVYFDVIKEVEDDENGIPHFTGHVIHLTFDGSNYVRPMGEEEIAAQYNYLIGEESNWHTHVPNYNMVSYDNVWDGIDVDYRYDDSGLKYDIILSPGADPDNILLTMKGQNDLKILGDSLVVDVDGEITLVDSQLDV
ncbi:MAG: hypothetical protein ACMUFK_01720, partial [Thermoplasmatota archaeon]